MIYDIKNVIHYNSYNIWYLVENLNLLNLELTVDRDSCKAVHFCLPNFLKSKKQFCLFFNIFNDVSKRQHSKKGKFVSSNTGVSGRHLGYSKH